MISNKDKVLIIIGSISYHFLLANPKPILGIWTDVFKSSAFSATYADMNMLMRTYLHILDKDDSDSVDYLESSLLDEE